VATVTKSRGVTVLAVTAGIAYVVLTVLVAIGATERLDVAASHFFNPDDVLGNLNYVVDPIVEGLKPIDAVLLFVLFVLVVSVRRRSWRPAAYAGLVLVVAGFPALATKVLLRRTDTHYVLSSIGAFPSGHTLAVLVCLGAALLLVRPRPAVWEWLLVLAADAVMAWAMVWQSAHWLTDVIGGALLGVAALAATYGSPLRARAPLDAPPVGRGAPPRHMLGVADTST
jgi:membrane-associated phospholipid phosphatase